MKLLKDNRTLLLAAFLLPVSIAKAQQIPDSATFAQAVKNIPAISYAPGQTKITLPVPPKGYKLLLKGTDRHPVIDPQGNIHQPLTDAPVNLYFVLKRQQDGVEMDAPMQLTIPGKYGAPDNTAPFVIPALREWHGTTGKFKISPTTKVVFNPADKAVLAPVAARLAADLNLVIPKANIKSIAGKPSKGDISLNINKADSSLGNEGYRIGINDIVEISAPQKQGAFWATRTILQILEQDSLHSSLPKGITRDYPKYAIRSFVLDDGRKFFTLEFLRNYVQFMSYYKMNDFHIHLNDNGFSKFFGDNWDSTYSAFRLENNTYPGLTAKDGFYTKKEFMALQDMADSFGIRIIPEIDVPAHSLALSKANPAVASTKYGRDHLNLDPVSWGMVDNIFKEYLEGPNPVFKGVEVHIGTDEYDKHEAEKFRAFTDHLIKFVEGYGKKVRMWGSLTHAQGKTPVKSEGVTMNAWYNGYAEPKDMIQQGYDLISTPDGWLYIVPAAGYYYDYLNIKKIYNQWEPNMIGAAVFPMGHPKIKGGAFAVWNDHPGNGITADDVHDRAFPAMQVLAEKMWNGHTNASNFDSFSQNSQHLSEGPGLNLRHKKHSKDSILYNLSFGKNKPAGKLKNAVIEKNLRLNGGQSYFETPITAIGYDYTISFDIKPDAGNKNNAVIFSSPYAQVKLLQQNTGKLGFSREGYNYNFNYTVPTNTWTHIEIAGTNIGTSLFVNGQLVERLEGQFITFPNTKDKNAKVQTLVFPLQFIGDNGQSFAGEINNIRVLNHAK
ncbi:MAG: family 20 glycosylhydrolase [Chitinophaga sp.]|uniref:family 20 glycosylhydrolase n=1 Tax=Chitinophaga sp. TaxID=1869181 RepID=UPI0025BBF5B2|nr:family 20 glycosylhydrolase [Chitinophaga sp.]MBV8255770.1 family 20 glycosylhydrolase [Chitinophaga sp.]